MVVENFLFDSFGKTELIHSTNIFQHLLCAKHKAGLDGRMSKAVFTLKEAHDHAYGSITFTLHQQEQKETDIDLFFLSLQ